MVTVEITCMQCGVKFARLKKEYDRQVKAGKGKFFCSRRCTGLAHVEHLPKDHSTSACNLEHLRKMNRSRKKNVFKRYLHRVRGRLHEIDLDLQYLADLWDKQHGCCALSRIPLVHARDTTDLNIMASLDRIDSTKGYVRGNVQFVACAINLAKGNRDDTSIHRLIEMLVRLHPEYTAECRGPENLGRLYYRHAPHPTASPVAPDD